MSSNNWNEYLIEDISEVVFSGGTPSTEKEEYWGGEYNWLSSGETRNTFITNTEKTITEAGVKNSSTKLAKKNDIVIASAGQGNTRGQVSLCKIDTFINQSIIAIRTNNKLVNPVYVFYNLKSRYKELRQISDGHSIRGSLTTKIINKMKINLPPIKDQNNIANILSSFDEKIEINNQISKKLEEMAQAIFKQWFVDFEFPNENGEPYKSSGGEMVESELGMIPKGWRVESLDKVADYLNGLAMQKYRPSENEKGIPVLKIKELRQGKTDENSDICTENIDNQYIVRDGDIIFSWSGTLLVDVWCGGKCGLNQHLFKVTSKKFEKWFYYHWTRFYLEKFMRIAESKATTMGHIKRKDLSDSKVLIPTEIVYEKINSIMEPLLEKQINTKIQSTRLVKIRDSLLPKLMSGEIRVPVEE